MTRFNCPNCGNFPYPSWDKLTDIPPIFLLAQDWDKFKRGESNILYMRCPKCKEKSYEVIDKI